MSQENIALAQRMLASLDRNDWTEFRSLVTPDFSVHVAGGGDMGMDAFLGFCEGWYGAFPGLRHNPLDVMTDGDRVILRLQVTGTQARDFLGVPASHQSISIESISVATVAAGKVVSLLTVIDMLTMMQQIGAIPAPAAAGA